MSKFGPQSERIILTIFRVKKPFFWGFMEIGLELFRSCLGIISGLKMQSFRCVFNSKGRCMTFKTKLIGPILVLWEGHFHLFQGQQTRSQGFLEVVLELFLSLQIQLVGVFSAWRVDICPLKSIFEINFWPFKRATLTIFRVVQE